MSYLLRAALAVAAIGAPAAANASTIVQTGSSIAQINQFNPAYGTLTSVTITQDYLYRIGILYGAFPNNNDNIPVHLVGTFGTPQQGLHAINTIVGTTRIDPGYVMVYVPETYTDTFTGDLSFYTGTGTNTYGPFYNIVATRADIAGEPVIDPYQYAFHGGAIGRTTVIYDYIAAAFVPEPATWALMLTGFGMMGYALRRRRASVALVPTA